MGCNVRILPSAEQEVEEIVAYLAGHGPMTARRFVDAYRKQLDLLASGVVEYGLSALPELAELGYHACRATRYILLYYREGADVVIAHVFHESRDYARLVLPIDEG